MRAVNLIPADLRGSSRQGGSGMASYALLGALAVVVLMVSMYALTSRSLSDKQAKVASIERQARETEARAGDLQAYTRFAELRRKRVQTVQSLVSSRFDWAQTLHELARTLPSNAWVSSVRATVTPDVSVDGETDPLRASISAPAIELVGCTRTQADVAGVMASLRSIDGVKRLSLSSSQKSDVASGAGGASGSAAGDSGDCTQGSARFPKFSLTLFLAAPKGSAATTTTGGTQ